jgi:enamine deaminase RidA (YjgF/YER057c/UK114 family)
MAITSVTAFGADGVKYIGANARTGSSQAVVIDNLGLVHTAQLLPRDGQGNVLSPKDAAKQANQLLDQLAAGITSAGGRADQIVKLNVYVAHLDATAAVEAALAKRFSGESKPAVSYVVTKLPDANCLIAMDAVARAKSAPEKVILHAGSGAGLTQSSVVPPGSLIYVAGQAEKGANLAEATRATLQSLEKTLQFLGRDKSDIIQLKSFLAPMANVADAQQQMAEFFAGRSVPPAVWVEWTMPLIEIEVIAWGGEKKKKTSPAVEFITPPGMTASPVYSRVARANSDRLIYLSGLYARESTDAAGEVTDIFSQLEQTLQATGSNFQHLVKATYYCANNATSTQLNELRPKYYHPARPPSASKALVNGVGRAHRGVTIDMIAVPHD